MSGSTNSVVAKVFTLTVEQEVLTKKDMHLLAGGGGEQGERGLAGSELGKHFYQNEENTHTKHHNMSHIVKY